MKNVKTPLVTALAAAFVFASAAVPAANVSVYVGVAPPAPRYEVVPAPRTGYLWAPGYWDYDHSKHVWKKGHWEKQRHGEHYSHSEWSNRDGQWVLNRGHWEKHG